MSWDPKRNLRTEDVTLATSSPGTNTQIEQEWNTSWDGLFSDALGVSRTHYPWRALSFSVAGHALVVYLGLSYATFLLTHPAAEFRPNLEKARILQMDLPTFRPFPAPKPVRTERRNRARTAKKTPAPLKAPVPVPVRREARRFEGPSLRLTREPRPVPAPTLIQMQAPQLTVQTQLQAPSILVLSNRMVRLPPRAFVRPPERPQTELPKAVVLDALAPRIDTSVGTLPVPRVLSERPALPVLPAVLAPVSAEAPKVVETSSARSPKADEGVTLIVQPEFRAPPASTAVVPPANQLGGSVSEPSQVSATVASATAGGPSRPDPTSNSVRPVGTTDGGTSAATVAVERISLPRDGKYDVVITQNTGIVAGSASLLAGRPVYSVYIRLGQRADWILQYTLPPDREPRRPSSGIIELGSAAPLTAPYAFLLLRPPITFKKTSSYAFIHGFINPAGRFEKLQEVGGQVIQNVEDLIDALGAWEFRPATKDGQPAGVEVLLCIPNPVS